MAKEHVHKINLTCWWIDWGKLIWNPQSLFLYGDHGGVSPHPFFGTLNLQENEWTWCNMSQLYTYYIIYHVDTLDFMIVQVPGWTVARKSGLPPLPKKGEKGHPFLPDASSSFWQVYACSTSNLPWLVFCVMANKKNIGCWPLPLARTEGWMFPSPFRATYGWWFRDPAITSW